MEPQNPADEQDAFKCPITTERMRDPVIASDGHSYERESIERWINQRKLVGELPTSPKTGLVLENEVLFPNHALRNAIQAAMARQPPSRSPSPNPKRSKIVRVKACEMSTRSSHNVTTLVQHAESLVDAGDVRGVLDALLPLGRLLSDPGLRARLLPESLAHVLSRTGIEPIHESLLCHQEHKGLLVFVQALAVLELSTSELASVEPTLAGVITVLNCADQNVITLLVECAAKALADACEHSENLVAEQVQQLADALCLVIRPRHYTSPKLQVVMQQRAIQHAMAGLRVLYEHTQTSLDPDAFGRAGSVHPSISLGTIHLISHAAALQLQRNLSDTANRHAPEPKVRLENMCLALALLSNLACYRMWSFGVLQFLKLVVRGAMHGHESINRVQLEGARLLEKHCQLRFHDAYDAVTKSGGREALVQLICRDTPSPDAPNAAEAHAEIVAVACHALRLLLETKLASAFTRDVINMQESREVMLGATVNNGAIEGVVAVLASPYLSGPMPPQIVNALALLEVFFVSKPVSATHVGNTHNYARFVLADGIGALVNLLRRHDDETSVLACLKMLKNTFCQYTNQRNTHGGDLLVGQLASVIQTMANHAASPAVQVECCSVMATHSVNMYSNNASTDASLVDSTLHPLLEALRRYPDDAQVQGAAIRALTLFVRAVRPRPFDEMAGPAFDLFCAVIKAIADAGGLALVMHALRKHQSATMVRAMACWLLAMLCFDPGVAASITTSGGPELALATLTHQHADAYGRYTAALLLSTMVDKPPNCRGHW